MNIIIGISWSFANGELLGKWGNFVNRTLQYINKSFDGKLSSNNIDKEAENKLKELYDVVGKDIDNGDTKDTLSKIFDFINYSFIPNKGSVTSCSKRKLIIKN